MNSQNYIGAMGGGPVLVSGTTNAFPSALVNTAPANIADLLRVTDQPIAFQTRGVTFLDQGFSTNVPLPPSHGSITIGGSVYAKYLFNQGAADWTDPNTAYDNGGTFLAPYDDPAIGRAGVAAFTMGAIGHAAQVVVQNELGPIGYAYDYNATSSVLGMAADEHTTVGSLLTPSMSGTLVALGVATSATAWSLVIDVYSDWISGPAGTLLTSTTVPLGSIGYQLVDLTAPVPLTANDGIAVLLTYGTSGAAPVVVGGDGLYGVTTGSNGLPSYPVASGLSYYLANSGTWVDFATEQYAATPWDSGVSKHSM